MDERIKNLLKPIIFIAAIIFAMCWLIKKPGEVGDYTEYIGYSVTGVTLIFLLYEKLLWKFIPWNRPPVLKKKYNGIIKYKYNNQEGSKEISIDVKQTWLRIVVNTHTDINSSYCVSGDIVKEHDMYALYYTYHTDPTAATREANPIQYGTCRMILNDTNERIRGTYWTSSKTIGDIEWIVNEEVRSN